MKILAKVKSYKELMDMANDVDSDGGLEFVGDNMFVNAYFTQEMRVYCGKEIELEICKSGNYDYDYICKDDPYFCFHRDWLEVECMDILEKKREQLKIIESEVRELEIERLNKDVLLSGAYIKVSSMEKDIILEWCSRNKVKINTNHEYENPFIYYKKTSETMLPESSPLTIDKFDTVLNYSDCINN